jgi:hypothetical protein
MGARYEETETYTEPTDPDGNRGFGGLKQRARTRER